ncbi:hypothetical protein [Novipirellula rosea]
MRETSLTCDNFRELVFAYEADWKSLLQFRTEWMQLLTSLIRIDASITGEFHDETKQAARELSKEWANEIMEGLMWPMTIRSVLDASLAPLPISKSREILISNIHDTIHKMVSHMVYQLDALTERCVLGKIEWFGDSACEYSFIDRKLVSRTIRSGLVGEVRVDRKKRIAWRTNETSGVSEKSVAAHVHDIVNAVSSRIGDGMVSIPPHVQSIIDNVPDVLMNDVRMIEGNLIRERCIEQDIGETAWTITEDVTVRYHFDPAIVLAERYVLIGWVDVPLSAETSRESNVTNELQRFLGRIFE